MKRLTSLAFLWAVTLAAQTVRIEGTVVDAGTGVPVSGAKAVLRYPASVMPIESVVTGAGGTFQLPVMTAGKYAVELSAPGFDEIVYGGAESNIEFDAARFRPGAGDTVRNIVVKIARSGGLRGRIRDAESREPVGQMTVRAWRSFWLRGNRQLKQEGIAFSGDNGEFHFDALPAGEYIIEIGNDTDQRGAEEGSTKKRYQTMFWPGGDPDNTAWLRVQVGAETDAGTIDYAKTEPIRVRAAIKSGCYPQSVNEITLAQQVGGASIQRQVSFAACDGKPFSVAATAPGTYQLTALSRSFAPPEGGVLTASAIATAEFRVAAGEHREIEMKMREASRIMGKVICECQAPFVAGPDRTGVGFTQGGAKRQVEAFDFNGEGTFAGRTTWSGPARIEFLNLPWGLYIRKISVNGVDTSRVVTTAPGSSETVEIVLSDSPSALGGTVVREDKPVAHANVVAIPWPIRTDDAYPDFAGAETDDNGAFMIGKLAPGTYQVVSVGPLQWSRKEEPGVVESWLASGEEITLADKESRTVRIESKLP